MLSGSLRPIQTIDQRVKRWIQGSTTW
jgi:hypothetical protein